MKTMKHVSFIVAAIAVAALAGIIFIPKYIPAPERQVACTMEAKLCSDGSHVARVGPSCDFSACPAAHAEDNWVLFSDPKTGATFKYPPTLVTKYIHPAEWPPKIQITNGPFACTETGSQVTPAGNTQKQTINGRTYCVTKGSEGAAGSIYLTSAYAFPFHNKVAKLTSSLRFVQCANYDEPQKSECNAERSSFELDGIIDRIATTIALNAAGAIQEKSGVK